MKPEILKWKKLSIIDPQNTRNNTETTFYLLDFVSFSVFRGQRVIIFKRHGSF